MRFTFGTFVLSPGHRVLLKDGRPVRLIPKYFDLLVLLVAERQRAVTRQEIFDRVWADVWGPEFAAARVRGESTWTATYD